MTNSKKEKLLNYVCTSYYEFLEGEEQYSTEETFENGIEWLVGPSPTLWYITLKVKDNYFMVENVTHCECRIYNLYFLKGSLRLLPFTQIGAYSGLEIDDKYNDEFDRCFNGSCPNKNCANGLDNINNKRDDIIVTSLGSKIIDSISLYIEDFDAIDFDVSNSDFPFQYSPLCDESLKLVIDEFFEFVSAKKAFTGEVDYKWIKYDGEDKLVKACPFKPQKSKKSKK